jgi:hypothetical protein
MMTDRIAPIEPDPDDDASETGQPEEVHFEEIKLDIEPVELIDDAEVINRADVVDLTAEAESRAPMPALGKTAPSAEQLRARSKHRWLMRGFFLGVFAVIYALIYWQSMASR